MMESTRESKALVLTGQEFLREFDFAHQHHLILNQPSTCAAKKDRVFLKSDGTGVT